MASAQRRTSRSAAGWMWLVGGVMHTEGRLPNQTDEVRHEMTGLGASIYLGFFALAALWLFLTSDGPVMGEPDDQDQRPDRSNSTNTSAEPDGSSPLLGQPFVAEVGVGVAVAAVGEQGHHRPAAPFGDHFGQQAERPPQVGAGRRPDPAAQHRAGMAGRRDGRRVRNRHHAVHHVRQERRLHPRPADALDSRRRPRDDVAAALRVGGEERGVLRVDDAQPGGVAAVADEPADRRAGAAGARADDDPLRDRVLPPRASARRSTRRCCCCRASRWPVRRW